MKILVQNFKTGELSVARSPAPRVKAGGVLVRVTHSAISQGTDRSIVQMARKGYLGKAMDRPDLFRKVLNRAKNEGFLSTWKVVKNLIAEPIPLGYSLCGEVLAVGEGVSDAAVGDMVACAGLGYANHAEVVWVSRNLFVRVPRGVPAEQAAFVAIGAIAMHGLRQAEQQFGATVMVVGLGLVGLMSVQLCVAAGLRVVGVDIDPRKFAMAQAMGALGSGQLGSDGLAKAVADFTRGRGVDAVLVTAGARDSGKIFEDIVPNCRDRARVVVVGDVKMDIQRRSYFQKEIEIVQSRSYGPGRYDPEFEEKGHDYPVGYVRWTERRNMEAFIDMIADGRLNVESLSTHRFAIDDALQAYDLVLGKVKTEDPIIGIVLEYPEPDMAGQSSAAPAIVKRVVSGKVSLGIIGTGQFAKGILLPALFDTRAFTLRGVASARGISAEAVRERYGGAYADTDAMRVIADPDIAAVVIATRHDSHGRYVVEALRHDKHVLVEKPLCLTRDELGAIEEAAGTSKGAVMVGFNRRFSPLFHRMRQHFEGRREPLSICYRVNANRIPLNHEAAWQHHPETGGGRIRGEVCHFIDLMQALTGARPSHVIPANARRDSSGLAMAWQL
jgi:threonine dehydrogenase-like Zn-dependent dehydrogenase